MAQGRTPSKQLSTTRLTNQYWRYKTWQGTFKPQLDIEATLPDFNRSIDIITQNDGTDLFIERSQMRTSADLFLRQIVAPTNTSIFASSGLQRIDLFGDLESTSYLNSPFSVGFSQPLFRFNSYSWQKKIEPLRYEEATSRYAEELEGLAYEAVGLFFDVYITQLDVEAAILDKQNADSLLVISRGRFEVGRIAETDLLQIELNGKNAQSNLTAASMALQNNTEGLRNFLGITEGTAFNLETPRELPGIEIDIEKALQQARLNRSRTVEFRRRLLEAERDLDEAIKEDGLNMSISGQFGLSQTAPTFSDAYIDLLDQERFTVQLNIPITDWGSSNARRQIAKSNQDLEQLQVEQDQAVFEREIIVHMQQFNLFKLQYELAFETYEVAQKRFELTQNRYLVGKIGTLDLNDAILEKERTRRAYFQTLKTYWLAYYRIRNLTLFDFVTNEPIKYNTPVFN
jgi:outer membrane protein TolC